MTRLLLFTILVSICHMAVGQQNIIPRIILSPEHLYYVHEDSIFRVSDDGSSVHAWLGPSQNLDGTIKQRWRNFCLVNEEIVTTSSFGEWQNDPILSRSNSIPKTTSNVFFNLDRVNSTNGATSDLPKPRFFNINYHFYYDWLWSGASSHQLDFLLLMDGILYVFRNYFVDNHPGEWRLISADCFFSENEYFFAVKAAGVNYLLTESGAVYSQSMFGSYEKEELSIDMDQYFFVYDTDAQKYYYLPRSSDTKGELTPQFIRGRMKPLKDLFGR